MKLTIRDIDDLQIALAIALNIPNASKRFEELWENLEAFRNDMCRYQRYQDKKGYSCYETQCGNSVDLEVSPISNGFTYCPFCAGTIEYILDADTDDDFAESELSNDELDAEVTL